MMELFLVVRREGNLGRCSVEVKKKMSPSKGILAVQQVTLDQPMELNFKEKSVSKDRHQ